MKKVFYPSHYCSLGFQPSFVVALPHIWRVYIASQVYPLTPSYGSNWSHKIADFLVLPYIYFKTTLLTNYSIYYINFTQFMTIRNKIKLTFLPHSPWAVRVLFSPMVSGRTVSGKKFVRAVSQKP